MLEIVYKKDSSLSNLMEIFGAIYNKAMMLCR